MPRRAARLALALVLALAAIAVAAWAWRPSAQRARGAAPAGPQLAGLGSARVAIDRASQVASAPPSARLSGWVRDERGGAIVGALACARWDGETEGDPPTCATVGPDGRFDLGPLAAGTWLLSASAPGYVPGRWREPAGDLDTDLTLGHGERRDDLSIQLSSGGVAVRGAVLDIAGGPIGGALVAVRTADFYTAPALTYAADDGSFVAWVAEGRVSIEARAAGYAESTQRLTAPTSRALLMLEPEAVLEGVVVERGTDLPVPGARVAVNPLASGPWVGELITDAAGRFRAAGLLPGRYQPSAIALGAIGQLEHSVLLEPGQGAPVRIEVAPAAVVRGRVLLDDGDGVTRACPPEFCSIALRSHDERRVVAATSAPGGIVTLLAVPPGAYGVSVYAAGYLDATFDQPLVVAADDVGELTWTIQRGATLAGSVRSASGTPLVDASVSCWLESGSGGDSTTSDATGRFVLSGLPPGAEVKVVARAPGHVDGEARTRVGSASPVDLRLEPGVPLTVEVVDPHGAPVPDVAVVVWRDTTGQQHVTDERGRLVVRELSPGTARIEAPIEGVPAVEAVLVAGRPAVARLVVAARDSVLTGVVVDASGAPVRDAIVRAAPDGDDDDPDAGLLAVQGSGAGASRPVMTDDAGAFELTGLAAGPFTVRAFRRSGGQVVRRAVTAGATLRLVLETPGELVGVVTRGGDAPGPFRVQLANAAVGEHRGQTFESADGSFAFADVPPGTYDVSVSAGDATIDAVVTVRAGQRADVRLELPRQTTLRGTLVALADRRPMAGVPVAAGIARRWSSRDPACQATTDSAGRFEIRGVTLTPDTIIIVPGDAGHGGVRAPVTTSTIAATELDVGAIVVGGPGTGVEDGVDLGFDVDAPRGPRFAGPLVVDEVDPDGPAARGGLRAGDEIIRVGGAEVAGAATYVIEALLQVSPRASVQLGLTGGRQVSVVTP